MTIFLCKQNYILTVFTVFVVTELIFLFYFPLEEKNVISSI